MNDVASPYPTPKPAVLDKRERMRFLAAVRRMWRTTIVDSVDQVAVLEKLDDESGLSGRYIFMTLMSAAIAVLGLLLSSPAVVIGAMLLSPLMGPIIGAGFALVVGDALELRTTARTLLYGTVLAIGISALIVFFSPIQTVTPEIAARTRPNLFDLGVALFSALAGAYAFIRGRDGTIVGVAIATALMPPLSVIGFGLATFNWTVFGGALLLFITNLMTIALSAAVMARYYGFSTALTKKQTRLQVLGILTAFALLAIPLSIALRQIAWETNAQRQAQSVIRSLFPDKARISQIELSDHDGNPRIVAYHATTGGGSEPDSVPWCSSFVNFCVEKAGLKGTDSKAARSWMKWGREATEFFPGCIVVLERGAAPQGHVGFFVGTESGRIRLLGGNQGDRVSIASFDASIVLAIRQAP